VKYICRFEDHLGLALEWVVLRFLKYCAISWAIMQQAFKKIQWILETLKALGVLYVLFIVFPLCFFLWIFCFTIFSGCVCACGGNFRLKNQLEIEIPWRWAGLKTNWISAVTFPTFRGRQSGWLGGCRRHARRAPPKTNNGKTLKLVLPKFNLVCFFLNLFLNCSIRKYRRTLKVSDYLGVHKKRHFKIQNLMKH